MGSHPGGPEAPPPRPQFEWAWQHPHASRRLTHVGPRLRSEAAFAFHLRVLAHMLRAPPWARLPLTVRWLRADLRRELCPPPPPHMPLAFGPPPARASAARSRAGPFAELESGPHRDAAAFCALCARAFQVSRPTGLRAGQPRGHLPPPSLHRGRWCFLPFLETCTFLLEASCPSPFGGKVRPRRSLRSGRRAALSFPARPSVALACTAAVRSGTLPCLVFPESLKTYGLT